MSKKQYRKEMERKGKKIGGLCMKYRSFPRTFYRKTLYRGFLEMNDLSYICFFFTFIYICLLFYFY